MNEEQLELVRAAFQEEAQDLLGELESGLLALGSAADDLELVGRIFRALHTIKGSGGMAGFVEVAELSHEVESLFALVRTGRLAVDEEIIDLGLSAKDVIAALLGERESETARRVAAEIRTKVRRRCATAGGAVAGKSAGAPPAGSGEQVAAGANREGSAAEGARSAYRITFEPERELFIHGINPLHLLRGLGALGACTVRADVREIPVLAEMNPEHCYLSWEVTLTTDRGLDDIRDVFVFVEGSSEVRIEEIADEEADRAAPAVERAGRPEGSTMGAGEAPERVRQEASAERPTPSSQAIRVRSEKLDSLVDLVGELVTVQAALSQTADRLQEPELVAIAEKVERLTGDLRETAMGMRMVPIGGAFGRLQRLVHDLSRQLGKEVELVTSGEETELDKTVIERLGDPLIHLVRNAIDHGIEEPAARARSGKPTAGTLRIDSAQSGGFVYIKVADDGAGLDPERILTRAVEQGIAPADSGLSKRQILNLIFVPGFSTASAVTEISGRGVGMDVVRTTVESLRGEVTVESERGRGTEVTLKIPLTLAIIEGLLVSIGPERFVFPLSTVDECIEYATSDRSEGKVRDEQRLVEVRGSLLPFVNLRRLFGSRGERPDTEQVVVAQIDGRRVGFLVDQVVGSQQTVIKNLGSVYRKIDGFSGATILGDGTMALILDLGRLLERAERSEEPGAKRISRRSSALVG